MKLISLKLRNFKGIEGFTLDPNGENIAIYGDNGTGKTTIADAFLWLLFDKDSANRTDFEIKTLDESGQPIHFLEHEVSAVLDIDGKQVTLKKIYSEKWTKKKGTAKQTFSGHETDYFIDGIPDIKKSDFRAKVASVINEDAFKLLANTRYFNEVLHWQQRRALLLEVCGDVSIADVIAGDKKLAKLPAILGDRSLEDHRKVIAARCTEINKELEKIPVRIDELQRGFVTTNVSPAATQIDLTDLKEQQQAKEREKAQYEAGGGIGVKQDQLASISAELKRTADDITQKHNDDIYKAQGELREVQDERDELERTVNRDQNRVDSLKEDVEQLISRVNAKREEWQTVKKSEYKDIEAESICPRCGQPMPQDTAKEKAEEEFNNTKAENLKDTKQQGLDLQAMADAKEEEMTPIIAGITEGQKELDRLQLAIDDMRGNKLVALKAAAPDLSEDEGYALIEKQKRALEDDIAKMRDGSADSISKVNDELADLGRQIHECDTILATLIQNEAGQKRIEDLKADEKRLAAEHENLESEMNLTDQFVRSKVSIMEDKINQRFQHARFKMFNELVNGGIEECCETLYQGVPYTSSLNNSARINVGLDIINTLAEHYGFTAPIFCDNAEAVTQLLPTTGQQIRLYVSEPDKELRVVA